jgi:hypothetical protein
MNPSNINTNRLSDNSNSCPDVPELMLWLDGELDEESTERIRTHLADCIRCKEIVETQRKIENTFRDSFIDPPDEAFKALRWRISKGVVYRKRTGLSILIPVAATILAVFIGIKYILPSTGKLYEDTVTDTPVSVEEAFLQPAEVRDGTHTAPEEFDEDFWIYEDRLEEESMNGVVGRGSAIASFDEETLLPDREQESELHLRVGSGGMDGAGIRETAEKECEYVEGQDIEVNESDPSEISEDQTGDRIESVNRYGEDEEVSGEIVYDDYQAPVCVDVTIEGSGEAGEFSVCETEPVHSRMMQEIIDAETVETCIVAGIDESEETTETVQGYQTEIAGSDSVMEESVGGTSPVSSCHDSFGTGEPDDSIVETLDEIFIEEDITTTFSESGTIVSSGSEQQEDSLYDQRFDSLGLETTVQSADDGLFYSELKHITVYFDSKGNPRCGVDSWMSAAFGENWQDILKGYATDSLVVFTAKQLILIFNQ